MDIRTLQHEITLDKTALEGSYGLIGQPHDRHFTLMAHDDRPYGFEIVDLDGDGLLPQDVLDALVDHDVFVPTTYSLDEALLEAQADAPKATGPLRLFSTGPWWDWEGNYYVDLHDTAPGRENLGDVLDASGNDTLYGIDQHDMLVALTRSRTDDDDEYDDDDDISASVIAAGPLETDLRVAWVSRADQGPDMPILVAPGMSPDQQFVSVPHGTLIDPTSVARVEDFDILKHAGYGLNHDAAIHTRKQLFAQAPKSPAAKVLSWLEDSPLNLGGDLLRLTLAQRLGRHASDLEIIAKDTSAEAGTARYNLKAMIQHLLAPEEIPEFPIGMDLPQGGQVFFDGDLFHHGTEVQRLMGDGRGVKERALATQHPSTGDQLVFWCRGSGRPITETGIEVLDTLDTVKAQILRWGLREDIVSIRENDEQVAQCYRTDMAVVGYGPNMDHLQVVIDLSRLRQRPVVEHAKAVFDCLVKLQQELVSNPRIIDPDTNRITGSVSMNSDGDFITRQLNLTPLPVDIRAAFNGRATMPSPAQFADPEWTNIDPVRMKGLLTSLARMRRSDEGQIDPEDSQTTLDDLIAHARDITGIRHDAEAPPVDHEGGPR